MSREKMLTYLKKLVTSQEAIDNLIGVPIWNENHTDNESLNFLANLNRPPLAPQVDKVIAPAVHFLEKHKSKSLVLIGEPGTGKTQMSYSSCALAAFNRIKESNTEKKLSKMKLKVMFLAPSSSLAPKMMREAKEIMGDMATVYLITNAKPKKGEVSPEEAAKMQPKNGEVLVFVMSKDIAKYDMTEELGFYYGDSCPNCGAKLYPSGFKAKNFKKFASMFGKSKPIACGECKGNLKVKKAKNINLVEPIFKKASEKYQSEKGNRKISIAKQFRKMQKYKQDKIFDYLIVDEVHEMANQASLQGQAYRDLVQVSGKVIIMTGTLTNGYASSLFYILQAIQPQIFKESGFGFDKIHKFVDYYGTKKSTRTTIKTDKNTGKTKTIFQELPKINDSIVSFLMPMSLWIKMEDLNNAKMPPYTEKCIANIPLDEDMIKAFESFKNEVITFIRANNLSTEKMKSFATKFIYMQNNPTFKTSITIDTMKALFTPSGTAILEEDGSQKYEKIEKVFNFDGLPEDKLYPKEKILINDLKEQIKEGRNILLYTIYNKAAGVSSRLMKIIEEHIPGVNIKVMPETLAAKDIEKWINNNPCQILIASPLRLAVGFDLVQFPSIFFYEYGDKLKIVMQARKRSYRAVGQDKPVLVKFYAYQGVQTRVLDVMAKKLKSAMKVEGSMVNDDSLAGILDDEHEFTAALNSIAEDVKDIVSSSFDENTVEGGRERPWTPFEMKYLEVLKEVRGETEDILIGVDEEELEIKEGMELLVDDNEFEDKDLEAEMITDSLEIAEGEVVKTSLFGLSKKRSNISNGEREQGSLFLDY